MRGYGRLQSIQFSACRREKKANFLVETKGFLNILRFFFFFQRWSSSSTVMCRRPYGITVSSSTSEKDSAVIITIRIQVGTLTDAFSFPLPVLTGVTVGNAPTSGDTFMQFTGVTIGFINYCPRLRIGGTAVEAVGWVSDSSLAGKVAAGTKATLVVDITVGKRQNYLTQAASYDMPDVVAPRFSYYSVALLLLGASPVINIIMTSQTPSEARGIKICIWQSNILIYTDDSHGILWQIVRFGVPNSPKIGQSLNSTAQSKLLKYALAVGVDYGQYDVTPKSQIGLTPATATEWNRCAYCRRSACCF